MVVFCFPTPQGRDATHQISGVYSQSTITTCPGKLKNQANILYFPYLFYCDSWRSWQWSYETCWHPEKTSVDSNCILLYFHFLKLLCDKPGPHFLTRNLRLFPWSSLSPFWRDGASFYKHWLQSPWSLPLCLVQTHAANPFFWNCQRHVSGHQGWIQSWVHYN